MKTAFQLILTKALTITLAKKKKKVQNIYIQNTHKQR